MPELVTAILLGFTVLFVKHAIADFFLQTAYQYRNKGIYGHPGGLLHAGIHAVLTLPVYLVLAPATIIMAIAIPVGEFAVHYNVDWLKEQIIKRAHLSMQDAWYWHVFGTDQLIHALTYIAIIAILVW